jgi:DNA gyrase subunit B
MSNKNGLHQLFAHSAQRLVLLDWMTQRATFEGESRLATVFSNLRELEEIQTMGHLDFLLKDAPLFNSPLGSAKENMNLMQEQIAKDIQSVFPSIRQFLLDNDQHDVEDWLNSVVRQNIEMLRTVKESNVAQHHTQLKSTPPTKESVVEHFTDRAEKYDNSSHWCTDEALKERVLSILNPSTNHTVLDVACGTGLVSKWFHKNVMKVTGVDITEAMYLQAKSRLDEFLVGPGESLPVNDDQFDIAISRQGIQFMNDSEAIKEMARAVKPGGRVCAINLCAYGESDKEEYFEILRLRNPVRRNFYLKEDLQKLFEESGLIDIEVHLHISAEDVDIWSDNGAISETRREDIRNIYRNATKQFNQYHNVQSNNSQFLDNMLFAIVVGYKPVE